LLSLKNLSLNWQERAGWYQIDCDINPGDMLHIQGDNGVGKSTFLRLLAGLLPYQGHVYGFGETQNLHADSWRRMLFYMGDLPKSWQSYRVSDIVEMQKLLTEQTDLPSAQNQLEKVGMQGTECIPWRMLSQGQKKKLLLLPLQWLKRKLWLLDEPFASLDAPTTTWLLEVIKNHQACGGMICITGHHSLDNTKTLELIQPRQGKYDR